MKTYHVHVQGKFIDVPVLTVTAEREVDAAARALLDLEKTYGIARTMHNIVRVEVVN